MKTDKRRVHELAKEFKVSSSAMKKILSELGFPVKSHMSTLENEVVDKVREKFEAEKEAVRKEIANIKRLHEEVRKEANASATKKVEPPKEKDRKPQKPRKKREQKKFQAPKVETRKSEEDSKKRKRRRKPRKKEEGQEVVVDKGKPTTRQEKPHSKRKDKKKDESKKFVSIPTEQKVDEKQVKEAVRKTLSVGKGPKKKYKKKIEEDIIAEQVEEKIVVTMTESIPLMKLAEIVNADPVKVIELCEEMGFPVTLNQRLDTEIVSMLAEEFEFELETITELTADLIDHSKNKKEDFTHRAPVVTVMGHVDHGKTTLLDFIRHSNIISSEFGGITQHVGAYEVHLDEGSITFIDTPGHAAFTAMRARGAKVTDIVILVVAADDGIMPQTMEAIDHAKAAGVPIIVAINKIDLEAANVERVKSQLAENNLIPEEWGGETIMVPISARKGENVQKLLEMVLLQAEMMELEAIPKRPAVGVIIETKVEQGRGAVATVLIQQGTLKLRDSFVTGLHAGRVRDIRNDRGKKIKKAGPSTPVIVTGLTGTPNAGDSFIVVKNDKEARSIATKRQELRKDLDVAQVEQKKVSLEDFFTSFQKGEIKELKLIIKADTDGSAEALSDALELLNSETEEVKLQIIRKGVGPVVENDILLASTSDAIIIGFNINVDTNAKDTIKREGIDVRLYNIIYKVTEDVKAAMEGLLEPIEEERMLGTAKIRQVFKIPRVGKVAGSYITSGNITRNSLARLIRDGEVIHQSRIESLKRFKEDVREVKEGYECGINIIGFSDFQEEDIIEAYEIVKVARKLSS